MASNTVPMSEVKDLLNFTIDRNLELEEAGDDPVAISIEASAGIGKTSIVRQVANERGMTFVKVNLAQLDEPGDICGYPQVEYECQMAKKVKDKDGNVKLQVVPGTVWLNAKQLDDMGKTTPLRQTGKTRMGYAKPAWIPEYNEKGTLILMDDYVRANPALLQACMDLVLEQKYMTWEPPKKTTFVLTNNPDDGTYNVNSLDDAQRSRFMNYEASWDEGAWCRWAESASLDGRCINFVMSYSNELFKADDEGNRICNPRSFVMFAKMIGGIKNWDNPDSLAFISTISKGCFKDDQNRFATMFTSFIRNKMHLLIQPKDMLQGGWDRIKKILEDTVYDETGQYRADIASLLERRFTNYVNAWLDSKDQTPIKTVKDRILDFLACDKMGKRLFTKDMFFHMIKNITADHKSQTNKLLFEPEIAKVLS